MKRRRSQSTDAALAVGDLVYLRHAIRRDREEWTALRDASLDHLLIWEPKLPVDRKGRPPTSDARFARLLGTQNKPDTQRHLVCRLDDHAITGMVNLSQIFRGPFQNAVMGWWCGEPFTKRGYTKDAVRALIHRALTPSAERVSRLPQATKESPFGLGLHRVEANIKPNNTASLALARSIGLREEGLSPNSKALCRKCKKR